MENTRLNGVKMAGLAGGPLVFVIVLLFFRPAGLSFEGVAVLAGTLWISTWWITEAVPIPAASLLPIIIFPLSGALDIDSATASYGNKMIFLYMGGFMIALAMERWDLHRRIALNLIRFTGTNIRNIIFGFMFSSALLSMWISNTATTLMMFPIALAVARQFGFFFELESPGTGREEERKFGIIIMLGVAYSSSIGGMATLIGTPTNAIYSAVIKEYYQADISFSDWMVVGLPVSLVLLLVCWFYLAFIAYRPLVRKFSGISEILDQEILKLGKIKREEKWVLFIFSLTAFAWITRSFFWEPLIPFIDDTIIAIGGALALFVIPGNNQEQLLSWQSVRTLPWGVLLLFGGGLAIAAAFSESGLASWIGNEIRYFSGTGYLTTLFVSNIVMNFLTEITSNVATASILLPILASIAEALGFEPFGLMMAACLSASCAFMLPVATPPNAIIFSSGYIRIIDMVRTGFWMNCLSILIITLSLYLYYA